MNELEERIAADVTALPDATCEVEFDGVMCGQPASWAGLGHDQSDARHTPDNYAHLLLCDDCKALLERIRFTTDDVWCVMCHCHPLAKAIRPV